MITQTERCVTQWVTQIVRHILKIVLTVQILVLIFLGPKNVCQPKKISDKNCFRTKYVFSYQHIRLTNKNPPLAIFAAQNVSVTQNFHYTYKLFGSKVFWRSINFFWTKNTFRTKIIWIKFFWTKCCSWKQNFCGINTFRTKNLLVPLSYFAFTIFLRWKKGFLGLQFFYQLLLAAR